MTANGTDVVLLVPLLLFTACIRFATTVVSRFEELGGRRQPEVGVYRRWYGPSGNNYVPQVRGLILALHFAEEI